MKEIKLYNPKVKLKQEFGKIMVECTNVCLKIGQELSIIAPEYENAEIARLKPKGNSIDYDYNTKFFNELGVNLEEQINEVKDNVCKACEKLIRAEQTKDSEEADKLRLEAREILNQYKYTTN